MYKNNVNTFHFVHTPTKMEQRHDHGSTGLETDEKSKQKVKNQDNTNMGYGNVKKAKKTHRHQPRQWQRRVCGASMLPLRHKHHTTKALS